MHDLCGGGVVYVLTYDLFIVPTNQPTNMLMFLFICLYVYITFNLFSVAAGGGSRLFFKNKLFTVGPESSGAHPGPICYRKNGYLAVTDANLVLGRIQPELFPSIFGPNEDLPLDVTSSITSFESLRDTIGKELGKSDYHIDEVAYGFIRVANEAMCRPIRNLTTMKGYDVTKHVLACFGGAGQCHLSSSHIIRELVLMGDAIGCIPCIVFYCTVLYSIVLYFMT